MEYILHLEMTQLSLAVITMSNQYYLPDDVGWNTMSHCVWWLIIIITTH